MCIDAGTKDEIRKVERKQGGSKVHSVSLLRHTTHCRRELIFRAATRRPSKRKLCPRTEVRLVAKKALQPRLLYRNVTARVRYSTQLWAVYCSAMRNNWIVVMSARLNR